MVRKTSSGFFPSTSTIYGNDSMTLPFHISRGYDNLGRPNVRSSHDATPTSSTPTSSTPPTIHDNRSTSIESDKSKTFDPSAYTFPYLSFMIDNPTVFHVVSAFSSQLQKEGYTQLSERTPVWEIKAGGKYYVTRNASAIIAFSVGKEYKPGNGMAIVAGHIDSITAKLKPMSKLPNKAGYIQLGVAPYAGALSSTWWDRDLGIGGKVLVLNRKTKKIEERLVKLDWPIARIPTLAPHYGAPSEPPFNLETQAVPIIALEGATAPNPEQESKIRPGTFAAGQPAGLVFAIASVLGIEEYSDIINWELELFDTQPAQLGGLNKEFIFAGRIDDKLCSYAAIEALLASEAETSQGIVKMVACFDDEEIGSLLRQGARSNFMSSVIERICESVASTSSTYPQLSSPTQSIGPNLFASTIANSFLISSDVTHAVNPNFLGVYMANHSPKLNVGIAVCFDPSAHLTTDSISAAFIQRVAEKCDAELQLFQIPNGVRSGGSIGPMTSARLGIRGVDAGLPQLSMHSMRATTGSLDPGLGVKLYKGFFDYYEEVDEEFK